VGWLMTLLIDLLPTQSKKSKFNSTTDIIKKYFIFIL